MIEKAMWPPSSGNSGSRLSSARERLIRPSTQRYVSQPRSRASEEPRTIPIGLEISSRPEPRTRRLSVPPTSFVISQVSRNDSPIAVSMGRSSNAGRKPMRYAPSVSSNGLTGPRTTSRPPRSTVTRTGLPSDSTMSSNIFDASTGVPLIATMRSPGRRPICAAGVGWPA